MPELMDTPRIYVACLAAYNAGTLHGKWIEATQDIEDIWKEIRDMLASSPEPNSEEWAIHGATCKAALTRVRRKPLIQPSGSSSTEAGKPGNWPVRSLRQRL